MRVHEALLAAEAPCAAARAEDPIATSGDERSPERIFALVYGQMRALAAGRRPDLDDLVQTAAEQALRALPSFEGRSRLSTWTFRICYLTLLKHERWHRRWLRRFSLTSEGQVPDAEHDAPGPSASLDGAERARALRAAVAALSPKRRAVVTLHDLEGLTVEEIAQVVDANVLTVRSRLRDGRKELARLLAEDPFFGDEACRRAGEP